ncbi:unnamed protein product [Orchesella dallaii]|uniref:C2H2-type domain-containing protein n=1 Tax=Orchesella dallaii TaxID=48710 RepID=A0ABP1QHF1_9HEXA
MFEHNTNSNGSLESGDSLMRCPSCPFTCGDESTLDNHLIHHQENPNLLHVCPTCSFRTSSKKSLKEHAKCHLPANYHHDWKNGPQKRIGRPPKKLAAEYQNGKMDNGEHQVHQQQQQQQPYRSDLHEDISSNESM